jgi:phosphoribosylformylglycinamidine synthase
MAFLLVFMAPIRYVDGDERSTTKYPDNPNGSSLGIAALCTPDGRHLCMMPHPERSFLKWQWGYLPEDWKGREQIAPWIKMTQNAAQWCIEHRI